MEVDGKDAAPAEGEGKAAAALEHEADPLAGPREPSRRVRLPTAELKQSVASQLEEDDEDYEDALLEEVLLLSQADGRGRHGRSDEDFEPDDDGARSE